MIKRRFYRLDHADGDNASDSSEPEAVASEESEEDDVVEVKEDKESCSTSSGYKSEDSSVNEVDNDTSGLLSNEADDEVETERKGIIDNHLSGNINSSVLENFLLEKDSSQGNIPACVLKSKSVFKCRICPRIICLNEETLNAHLKSKRHSRSEKLLKEGRLKAMLNSNGEFETREILAASDEQNIPSRDNPNKQNRRWKRQSSRQSKKKSRQNAEYSAKKRRKNGD